MTREQVLIILGILVLVSPWSGIPLEWLTWAYLLIGLAIIGIAFTMRGRSSQYPNLPPPVRLSPEEEPRPRSSSIAFS